MTNKELQAKYVGKWVQCIDKAIGEVDKWYQIEDVRRNCDYCVEAYINSHWIGWREYELVSHHFDCDNLMDYNPDHIPDVTKMVELVVEQHEEFEEITENNFKDVLFYNNYIIFSKDSDNTVVYKYGNRYIHIKDPSTNYPYKYRGTIGELFQVNTYSWDDVVNIIIPKFGLKPIPKFDFTKYLTDNGGVISYHQNSSSKTIEFNANKIIIQVSIDENGECNFMGRAIEKSKQNADAVLNALKLWKDLK